MLQHIENFDDLKFIVVTGKGGTGKSVTATALAQLKAASGARTLLAEIATSDRRHFSRLHDFLDCEPLGHEAIEIDDNLDAVQYHPMRLLKEYVQLKIPGGRIAGKILDNKVIQTFFETIPGLFDLVSLGKIWYQLMRSHDYDCVVLDAHASGHCLNMLRVPESFQKITRFGPLYQDATKVKTFLENPKETAVVFLSIPEEMALSEANDYHEKLRRYNASLHIVNRCFPEPDPAKPGDSNQSKAAHAYFEKRQRQEHQAISEILNKSQHWQTVEMPFFFPAQKTVLQRLRTRLEMRND